MQLNSEDGGNRKYIMVQLPETTDEVYMIVAEDEVAEVADDEPVVSPVFAGEEMAEIVDGMPPEIGVCFDVNHLCGTPEGVAPGIRLLDSAKDDQLRTATPLAAVHAGANHIIVGRPITRHPDPVSVARAIVEEIA